MIIRMLLLGTLASLACFGADESWKQLFNGRDLSGWVPVNVAPNTFSVRDGIIVSTGKPTGVMRTEKQYENFELELEWKHIVPGGNAGLFVWSDPVTAQGQPFTRSIEVQILDGHHTANYTSDGDVFSIHGARFTPDRPHPGGWERSLPSERRAKPAGEWNHYRLVCKDGDLKLAVNGKVVSGGFNATPRKGYVCLEAEGSECHFRNIKIKELPSTNPKAEDIAAVDDGFTSIYTGLNLDGWTTKQNEHWKAKDWTLEYDGKGTEADASLSTVKRYRDFVMICDWRLTEKSKVANPDIGLLLRGARGNVNFVGDKPVNEWNRAIITTRRDAVTVEVNGRKLFEEKLPGIPEEGPIALRHRDYPIQFANIYIKDLSEK